MANKLIALDALLVLLASSTQAAPVGSHSPGIRYVSDEHALSQGHSLALDGAVYKQPQLQHTRLTSSLYTPAHTPSYGSAAAAAPAAADYYTANVRAVAAAAAVPAAAAAAAPAAASSYQHSALPSVDYSHASSSGGAQFSQQQHIGSGLSSYRSISSAPAHGMPLALHYSPSTAVSHMSFEGFGTRYSY